MQIDPHIEPTFSPPLQWNSSKVCCVFRLFGDPRCGASVVTRTRGGDVKTLLGWIFVEPFWAGSGRLEEERGAGLYGQNHAEQGDG